MKKTKVVIPALGIIAFATAASITGTVAWFTASRSVTITAGEFAVINTKDNLSMALASGVGTTADTEAKTVTVASTNLLTDGTVDHTSYTAKPQIIAPDSNGVNIGKYVDYDVAIGNADLLKRGTYSTTTPAATYNIYTAFTWDITFTVSFAGSQDKKVGLFLDLSQDTWAHEKFVAEGGESSTGVYNDAACKNAVEGATLTADTTYYKEAPDDTGKGFRIAFIPKTVGLNSMGYSKIWAPNQTAAKSDFVDMDRPADFENKAYVVNDLVYYNNAAYKCKTAHTASGWVAANWEPVTLASKTLCGEDPLNPVSNMSEATATTSLTTTLVESVETPTWAAATAGEGKVIMASGDTTAVPADGAVTSAEALNDASKSLSNYLGYFAPKPNDTVSMTFRCIAYYEGTDENITAEASTIYETMTTSLRFGVSTLKD